MRGPTIGMKEASINIHIHIILSLFHVNEFLLIIDGVAVVTECKGLRI